MVPDVSVLVPVHDALPYLRQCLESLHAQTLERVEFICVDDGSTDDSPDVLDKYARNDRRFHVVHQDNRGYGAAMNVALGQAQGTYVGVLEADDWAEPGTFEALYALATEHGYPDIVKANHFRFLDGQDAASQGNTLFENYPQEACGQVFDPLEDKPAETILSVPAIWAAIYRREFVACGNVRFLETPGATFQDTGFVVKAWLAANTAFLTHDAYVHYRFGNEGSSTVAKDKALALVDEWASIEQFARSRGYYESAASYLAAKKFESYEWNLQRVSADAQKGFATIASAEFGELNEQGVLDEALYTPRQWARLQEWIADPQMAVENAKVANLRKNGLPTFFARLHRRLRRNKLGDNGVSD